MPDLSKKEIANRLAQIIREKRITQEALGDAAGKTKSAANDWLKTGRASNASLQKIADKYNYNFLWLATGQGEKHTTLHQQAHQAAYQTDRAAESVKGNVHKLYAQQSRIPPMPINEAKHPEYNTLCERQRKILELFDQLNPEDAERLLEIGDSLAQYQQLKKTKNE